MSEITEFDKEDMYTEETDNKLHEIWQGDYKDVETQKDYSAMDKQQLVDEWLHIAITEDYLETAQLQLDELKEYINKFFTCPPLEKSFQKLDMMKNVCGMDIVNYPTEYKWFNEWFTNMDYYISRAFNDMALNSAVVEAHLKDRFNWNILEWSQRYYERFLEEKKERENKIKEQAKELKRLQENLRKAQEALNAFRKDEEED